MTGGLAATLPLGALSRQDTLYIQAIVVAQPTAQVTYHVKEELIDARNRDMHPELEHRPRQGTARSDRNRALSRASLGRA